MRHDTAANFHGTIIQLDGSINRDSVANILGRSDKGALGTPETIKGAALLKVSFGRYPRLTETKHR